MITPKKQPIKCPYCKHESKYHNEHATWFCTKCVGAIQAFMESSTTAYYEE